MHVLHRPVEMAPVYGYTEARQSRISLTLSVILNLSYRNLS